MAIVFELPVFVIGADADRDPPTRKLRKNRRIGYSSWRCIGVALPGVDPVTTILETIPLLVLYEASIWPRCCSTGAPRGQGSSRRRHVSESQRGLGAARRRAAGSKAAPFAARTAWSSR